jgi:hypothetical protein
MKLGGIQRQEFVAIVLVGVQEHDASSGEIDACSYRGSSEDSIKQPIGHQMFYDKLPCGELPTVMSCDSRVSKMPHLSVSRQAGIPLSKLIDPLV